MSDVIISGGGLVGLALAAALDSAGLKAVVVDPADPDAQADAAFDGRTSAVSSSSMRMFETIGIADHLPAPGSPIRTIQVADGLAPGGLAFEAGEEGEPLGWMHENRNLRRALIDRARAGKNLDLRYGRRAVSTVRDAHGVRMTLDDGSEIAAPLHVAAEGRNSPTREAAGIRVARWKYDHHAIVSVLAHDEPHGDVAYEIFYPEGPFALLPMTDLPDGRHRSAIVWSVPSDNAPGFLKLSDADFAAEAEAAAGGFLGRFELLAPRSTYPLGFHRTARITDERLVLVGDAAHGIHPIAGQGVNLGYRDAAALAEVLVEGRRLGMDLGDAALLDRYATWRGLDSLSVAASTDGFVRMFGVPGRTASVVRRLGMGIIDRIGPLKERLKDEAQGTSGDLPLLLRGLPI
ncbi:FAD-dependent monooxygenase [Sphingomicrobium aestuariivivum]|uniref:FAD-dependent monooxygenase n=1 Tax=Sphingomicrobium aestuariivivum TaxID=1582356 RepID=UPI001FD6C88E|nr:FAD-dependent monooxygenase [Sphingomicrobium aestuariivivum]MCJ8191141.1 FAD-dependent monooxygenase [Sphingomicrobium aestuariivivum]